MLSKNDKNIQKNIGINDSIMIVKVVSCEELYSVIVCRSLALILHSNFKQSQ